jgi:hypothetical protein
MLLLHRGDGTYAEIAQFAGLEASEWSWSPIFLDVDLDGYEDLLVANGFIRDNMNLDALEAMARLGKGEPLIQQRRLFPPLATPNKAFRNLGGLKFAEVSHQWGFDTPIISQGMCLADLDNDGDMDVVVNNLNSMAGIYRNDTGKARVAVILKGRSPNTHGIGAKIRVYGGAVPMQSQEIISGGRYLSCDQAMRVFAAGSLTNKMRIEVDWPGGQRSVVKEASANYIYEIEQGAAVSAPPTTPAPAAQPLFQDVSYLLAHTHHEEPFDDFARQPTLPKRLSQLGPGVCWCDLNGDGWEDLAVASGKGGALAVFLNNKKGGFQRAKGSGWDRPAARDQTCLLAWPQTFGPPALLVGSANYEDGSAESASVLGYDLASGTVTDVVTGAQDSIGPLAWGDLDGDGNLDLFVGGRVRAGRYPEAASSRIFRARAGKLVLDEANTKLLEHIGLVSAAIWSDLDGDGFPELLLACEWGPIRIFHNDHGRLVAWNPEVFSPLAPRPSPLSDLTGWWNGIMTGDLDGDGHLDIIASNWGQNSKYQSHRAAPLRLYFADFTQDGTLGLLEASFEPGMGKYVPERRLDVVAQAMPFLRGRFSTWQSFAEAGIEEALGEHLVQAQKLEATCLESTLLLNRGQTFERRSLPAEAQLAPAFAVVVADFDGDGFEDLFLGQNFFAVEPETSRYDAGRSLLLKGDGHGGLEPVPGQQSGLLVYGEQRGAAAADFDGDGRTDLVVTQNAGPTRLFKNVRGKPGLRVRLKGPPGNPFGFGAQMRLKSGDHLGPVREVHGGGGYWSQDSPVQVLTGGEGPLEVWVRWPGGKSHTVAVPSGAAEIQIAIDGQVTPLK